MYAALTRAAVLDAAKSLFVEKGFDATSVEDIGKLAQASKGAVYHHFSDKQEIFAELFRAAESAIMQDVIAAMATDGEPWDQFVAATRAFLHGFAHDDAARSLLRQVIGVLGWDRVRAIDEEVALPLVRALLEQFVKTGEIRPLPVDATSEMLFSLFCDASLFIAAADDAATASDEVETVIFAMLDGLRSPRTA